MNRERNRKYMKTYILKENETIELWKEDEREKEVYEKFVEDHAAQYALAEKEKDKDNKLQRVLLWLWILGTIIIFVFVFSQLDLNNILINPMIKKIAISVVLSAILWALIMIMATTMPSCYNIYMKKNNLMYMPPSSYDKEKDMYKVIKEDENFPIEKIGIYQEPINLSNYYLEDGTILYFSSFQVELWDDDYCGVDLMQKIIYAPVPKEIKGKKI